MEWKNKIKLSLSVLGFAAIAAQAESVEQDKINHKLQELDQKIKVLERLREIEESSKQGKKEEKSEFSVRTAGFIQSTGRWYLEDEQGRLANTFELRRARFDVRTQLQKNYSARVHAELAGGAPIVLDAFVDAQPWSWLGFRIGLQKADIGLEQATGPAALRFVDQAATGYFQINRDVGVLAKGKLLGNKLDYSLGVFNGGAAGAKALTDVDDSKEFLYRVIAAPFAGSGLEWVEKLHFGLGGTMGKRSKIALPSYRSPGRQRVFAYNGDSEHYGYQDQWVPQAYWHFGSVGISGEYARENLEVRNKKHLEYQKLTQEAWFVQFQWVLTGEESSVQGIRPAKPLGSGGLGAWEIAVRAQGFKADKDAFSHFASDKNSVEGFESLGLALNWFGTRHINFSVQYDYTKFNGQAKIAGKHTESVLTLVSKTSF
jgi:phosphate-selective porin OprO and OprP